MLEAGLAARITCIDPRQMPARFADACSTITCSTTCQKGWIIAVKTASSIRSFSRDPCSAKAVDVVVGEIVEREGFVFTDLLPA